MTSAFLLVTSFIIVFCLSHGEDISGKHSPPSLTRPLFRGARGALRIGVAGVEPPKSWGDFPAWRRFFNAWMTRTKGPFVSVQVDHSDHMWGYRSTKRGANGTWWTQDTRHQFNVTLPDEMLDRLGAALRLNVSYSHVEVVLSTDALADSQPSGGLVRSKDVDAYMLFVESSSDASQVRRVFFAHDQQAVSYHFHASKWSIRKGDTSRHCECDALKKAFDTIVRAERSLTSVDWTQSELDELAEYELRSLKPVLWVINEPRDEYIRKDPTFVIVTETERWVYENYPGGRQTPVLLTNIELEEEQALHNASRSSNFVSIFGDILGTVLRELRLTRFYALHESKIQAWHIPADTHADVAAGVVFHEACVTRYSYNRDDFCTTSYHNYNETAYSFLTNVDVGRADVFARHTGAALGEKDFTRGGPRYRIQDGDVVKFVIPNERNESLAEPDPHCVGFEDTRPRLLHPIGSDLRICLSGLSNAGKTTAFNRFTGSNADASPNVFTTRKLMARSTKIADDRFDWLAKQFPKATLRPSTVTFVDTPALVDKFVNAPWKDDVLAALRSCDIIYLVIRAFNDSTVEQWEPKTCHRQRQVLYSHRGCVEDDRECDESERSSKWHAESSEALVKIMRTHDKKMLEKLRKDATYR